MTNIRSNAIKVSTEITGESMTQQSHHDQTDINAIVERFDRTGMLPTQEQEPHYMDCTELQDDLTEMIERSKETITAAEQHLAELQNSRNQSEEQQQQQHQESNNEPAPDSSSDTDS